MATLIILDDNVDVKHIDWSKAEIFRDVVSVEFSTLHQVISMAGDIEAWAKAPKEKVEEFKKRIKEILDEAYDAMDWGKIYDEIKDAEDDILYGDPDDND